MNLEELHRLVAKRLFAKGYTVNAYESDRYYAQAQYRALENRLRQGFQVRISGLGTFYAHPRTGRVRFRLSRTALQRIRAARI